MSENKSEIRYDLLGLSFLGLLALGLMVALFGEIPWINRFMLYGLIGGCLIALVFGLAGLERSRQMMRQEIVKTIAWLVILVIWLTLRQLRVVPNLIKISSPIIITALLNILISLVRWFQTRRYQKNAGSIE